MSYEKLVKLIILLDKNTSSGDVQWEESTKSNAFETSFPNYTVMIRQDRDIMDEESYRILIIDNQGDVVEEATYQDFQGMLDGSYGIMKRIYEIARRQAKGVEQALDDILSNLNDPDDVPW